MASQTMLRAALFFALVAGSAADASACERLEEQRLALDGADLTFMRCVSNAPRALLWFADHHGFGEAELAAARTLAGNAEVWMFDIAGSLLLPALPSSLDALSPEALRAVRADVERRSGKPVDLVASGRAARLALRAGGETQDTRAVLLFPILYAGNQPGEEVGYLPEALSNHMRLAILQPMASAGFIWIDQLAQVLGAMGAKVAVLPIPGVRDGFFGRPDANAREQDEGARLGAWIARALAALDRQSTGGVR
jgi:hypothetical protein